MFFYDSKEKAKENKKKTKHKKGKDVLSTVS